MVSTPFYPGLQFLLIVPVSEHQPVFFFRVTLEGQPLIWVCMILETLVMRWVALLIFKVVIVWQLKPGHSEEDCPITIISENKRFSSFLANGPIKFKYSTMHSLKTLKPFELTWPLRKQPSNLWMLLVCLPKTLRIIRFQKSLWLDNLHQSALVWVVVL